MEYIEILIRWFLPSYECHKTWIIDLCIECMKPL